jgi:hypothetical protein
MRSIRLTCSLLILAVTPAVGFAQAGVTPLMLGPEALSRRDIEFRGYVTIEDDLDLFGVYRQGVGQGFDFGVRAGYSDFRDGGLHIGGDLRYELPWGRGSDLRYAAAAGLQLTFGDTGDMLRVPLGISIGGNVGTADRTVLLYGLPHLSVERFDPDPGKADTDLEFGVELGGEVELTQDWIFSGALTIATNDNDNVELALGVIYRR